MFTKYIEKESIKYLNAEIINLKIKEILALPLYMALESLN